MLFICEISDVLNAKGSREKAEKKFSLLIASLEPRFELNDWRLDVQKMSKKWISGLFAFLETDKIKDKIPRTNNGIEQYIRLIKGDFTKILNRKFIHRFFLRRSEFWVFARELSEPIEVGKRLERCDVETFIHSKQRFNDLSFHFRLERGCARNFVKQCARVVKRWFIDLK